MPACDKWNALDRAALEQMTVPELEELLRRMLDAPAPAGEESGMMLEIMEILETRADSSHYIRADAEAALERFRETFLPSADTEDEEEPALRVVADRSAPAQEKLPPFIAAFTAEKPLSPREADEIRHMIEDYRKEL